MILDVCVLRFCHSVTSCATVAEMVAGALNNLACDRVARTQLLENRWPRHTQITKKYQLAT